MSMIEKQPKISTKNTQEKGYKAKKMESKNLTMLYSQDYICLVCGEDFDEQCMGAMWEMQRMGS